MLLDTILNYIGETSGTSFLFLSIFIFFGLFINQITGKGDLKYFLLVISLILIISFKVFTTEGVEERYYLHINELIAFPLSFSIIHFFSKIKITRRQLGLITNLVIIIQLLNITRFSVFKAILPQYNTTFSLTAAIMGFYGAWLLMHGLYKRKAILILLISTLCTIISLIKWQMIIFPMYVLIFFAMSFEKMTYLVRTLVMVFLLTTASIFLFLNRDTFVRQVSGYSSFEEFYIRRISKDNQVGQIDGEEVYHNVGGIADGGRFFIWSFHFEGWLDGNLFTGLDLNFTNPFHYPEHNVFVFYITRLGVISLVYVYFFNLYFTNKTRHYRKNKLGYNLLILYMILLFSVGSWYGVPRACFLIGILTGLFQNNLNFIHDNLRNSHGARLQRSSNS